MVKKIDERLLQRDSNIPCVDLASDYCSVGPSCRTCTVGDLYLKAELVDVMGDDLRVVNAARVSFDKESDWEEGEITGDFKKLLFPFRATNEGIYKELRLSEKDKKLINYLAKHGHWTPFSHPQVTIRETVPIFVARQRFKHMVGFTYNEVSRRYVDDAPTFFVPTQWRGKPENAKQGSSDNLTILDDDGDPVANSQSWCDDVLEMVHITALQAYNRMIEKGVAPEQARMVLPQSMYTSYYTTGSLAAWARAYKQRIDSHSQQEIRELAIQWGEIIQPLFPVSWEALIAN